MSASRPLPSARAYPAAVPLVLAAFCWGSGTVLSKGAVGMLSPVLLLAVQLTLSVAFLALVARLRGEPVRFLTTPRLLGALGLLNPGLAYALGLIALTQVSASVVVIVWAIEPAVIAILASRFLGERLSPAAVVLTLVAVGGIAVIAGAPGSGTTWIGVTLTAAGVLCCAVYSVAARRWLPAEPHAEGGTITVVIVQQLAALGLALGLVVVVGLGGGLGQITVAAGASPGVAVAAVLASGVVYYGLAYAFYLSGLRGLPASIAATSFYLIPVFGLAIAFVAGERLEPRAWLGGAIVLGAVAGFGWLSREQAPGTERPGGAGGGLLAGLGRAVSTLARAVVDRLWMSLVDSAALSRKSWIRGLPPRSPRP
jgi:probable blue pigment (indigoidine) exporter